MKKILPFAITSNFHGNLGPLVPQVSTLMLLFSPFYFIKVFGTGPCMFPKKSISPYNDTWMVSSKLAKAQKLTTYYVYVCSSWPSITESLFFQHFPFCMWHWQILFTTLHNMLCTLVKMIMPTWNRWKWNWNVTKWIMLTCYLCRLCTKYHDR